MTLPDPLSQAQAEGEKAQMDEAAKPCPVCEGTGKRRISLGWMLAEELTQVIPCSECLGTGKAHRECECCQGRGKVLETP